MASKRQIKDCERKEYLHDDVANEKPEHFGRKDQRTKVDFSRNIPFFPIDLFTFVSRKFGVNWRGLTNFIFSDQCELASNWQEQTCCSMLV